jgi:hypothetical protein
MNDGPRNLGLESFRSPRVTDDAGREHRLFDMTDLQPDSDPELVQLSARVATSVSASPSIFAKLDFADTLIFLAAVLLPLVAIAGAAAIGASAGVMQYLPAIAVLAGMMLLMPFMRRRLLRRRAHTLVATLTAYGRCPACAYCIAAGLPDERGLLLCPECAAVWRVDRFVGWRALEPAAASPDAGHVAPPQKLCFGINGTVRDFEGAARPLADVRAAAARAADLGALARDLLSQTRARRWLTALGLLAGMLFMAWRAFEAVSSVPAPAGSIMSVVGAVGSTIALPFFAWSAYNLLAGRSQLSSARTARIIREHDRCPCCLGRLSRASAFNEVTACPGCLVVWGPVSDIEREPS